MKRCFFSFLFIFLIAIPFGASMGLTGPELLSYVSYEPGLERTFSYCIKPGNAYYSYSIGFEGEYKKYLSTDNTYIKATDDMCFEVLLKLPENLYDPGNHDAKVVVTEVAPQDQQNTISAVTGAIAIIVVKMPYPGKYITASLKVPDMNVNSTGKAVVKVDNRGTDALQSVYAQLSIYHAGEFVRSVRTNQASMASKEITDLTADIDTRGFYAGDYDVNGTVYFDGEEVNVSDRFRVGALNVALLDYTRNITKGGIVPFNMTLKNLWSSRLDNVYVNLRMGTSMFSSPTVSLEPWATQTIVTYIDSSNLPLGQVPFTAEIHYATDFKIEGGVVVVSEKPQSFMASLNLTTILIIIVIAFFIINIILFFRKKK